MKASDLLVKCLESENVEYIFGLPGEENLELMESLSKNKTIKFITTRHEQGAAFMADVYGRIKHKSGVCLATLGPGALNLATGVASANLDHSPLVAITGQADFHEIHREQHQYIDIVEAFRPLTKWNTRISSADSIPEVIRKAFHISMSEKQGATHIELPNDIAAKETPAKPLNISPPSQYAASIFEAKKAADLINNSKNPMILCGNGVIRTQSTESLLKFVEKTNIPTSKTFMSKGAIPGSHPLSMGTVGTRFGDHTLEELKSADLIIAIGYDLVEFAPSHWNPDLDKKIIRIHTVTEEFIDSYYQFSADLVGELTNSLSLLGAMIKRREPNSLQILKQKIISERENFKLSYPLSPQEILVSLRKSMKEDDILISDVGMHKIWISRLFATPKPNTVIISNGLASMGISVPGAIGAKIAKPEVNVFSANGDGGFLMNVHELETAKRENTPFVALIFNDGGYGMIEQKQKRQNKSVFGVKFTNPDFVKLAQSFGAKGYRIDRVGELEETIKLATKSQELCIIDIPMRYSID